MSYLASVARAPVAVDAPSSDGPAFVGDTPAMEYVSEVAAQPASSIPVVPATPPQEPSTPRTPTIVEAIAPPSPAVVVEREVLVTSEPPSREPSIAMHVVKAEVDLPASVSPPVPPPREAPPPPSFTNTTTDRPLTETSPVQRIDETRVVVHGTSDVDETARVDVDEPARVDVAAAPAIATRVLSHTVERPAPLETRAPTTSAAPRRNPGPTQVHIGAIALTVKASPSMPPLQPPPAAPAPAPARSREGLGFSASRHYLRWTGS